MTPSRTGSRRRLGVGSSAFLCTLLVGCTQAVEVGESSATAVGGQARPVHLRVLATHDIHGALRPSALAEFGGRSVGGIGSLAAFMDSAEAACACPTLRMDGGDQMQGTLESNLVYGASVVGAFNLLGMDAAALGNHELDWGIDTLRARLAEAEYPWLAANVFERDTGERPDWARPWVLVEKGGVRVGVVGYITSSTPTTTSLGPEGTSHLDFRRGAEPLEDAVEAVRRLGSDFTIIVAHAGGDCQEDSCSGEMVEVVRGLPSGSVDLVVGGHTHRGGGGVVSGVPMVRAGSHGRVVSVVDLRGGPDGEHTFEVEYDTVYARDRAYDSRFETLLAPYFALADSLGNERVTTMAEALDAEQLGDFIADAIRTSAEADVGMYNPGGVRSLLDAGPATYADLYRVLPFGNTVVTVELSGREIREVVEHGLRGRPYHFANLAVGYEPDAPPGERLDSLRLSDGRPLERDRRYRLATANFLAEGGDGFSMLTPLARESGGELILDAVIQRLRSLPQPVGVPEREWLTAVRR